MPKRFCQYESREQANAIYYNYFADASSPITDSSYTDGHLTRWQRLDYMKTKFADAGDRTPYDLNKMRYYGEYSAHMYGYFVFGGGPFSGSLDEADVNLYSLDGRFFGLIDFAAFIFGLLGF